MPLDRLDHLSVAEVEEEQVSAEQLSASTIVSSGNRACNDSAFKFVLPLRRR